jgi:cytoskeletal protein CcmA (bactofilin family)
MAEKPTPPAREDNTQKKESAMATIGESVSIVGDVTGKEDLVINGSIEGDINLRENDIVIGAKGRINANVAAENITVKGEVKGELRASVQVTIKPSGKVVGDIRAPRVILDDGCQFKGSVDMDEMHASSESRSSKMKLGRTSSPSREHPIKLAKKSLKS